MAGGIDSEALGCWSISVAGAVLAGGSWFLSKLVVDLGLGKGRGGSNGGWWLVGAAGGSW